MKITVAQWDLANALRKLSSVAPVTGEHQILQNVLLQATDEGLYCTATNLTITEKILIQGLLEEPGEITVNCRKLTSLISSLDNNSQIDLSTTSNDRIQVSSGKGKYKIGGQSAEQFYDMPDVENTVFEIPSGNLRMALIDTDFCAAQEEAVAVFNNVCLTFKDNGIEFAACNRQQLGISKYETKIEEELDEILIPLRACQEIKKVFSEDKNISVSVSNSALMFSTDTHKLLARKGDSSNKPYPNYLQLIDFEDLNIVIVNREQLQAAIKRVSIFAEDGNYGIILATNGEENILDLKVQSSEYDIHEPVEIESKTGDVNFKINARYLTAVLQHLSSENVLISFDDVTKQRITIRKPETEDQIYMIALLREDA